MGKLLGEWNDLEAAEHRLTEGIELSRAGGIAEILLDGYVALAQARNARGDLAGALEAIREAERLLERVRVPRLTARVSAYRAQLWMTWGDSEAVDGWVRECGFGVDDEPDYLQEVEHLTLARALIFQGRYDRAARFLERLLGAAEDGAWMASVIEILILQALALRAQGETEGAMKKLGLALTLAEPEGYVRTFVDEGEPMSELLHRAASLGIARDYAGKLLVAFDGGAALPAAVEATKDTAALSEPLTERELEVLRLIAAGMLNRGIAQRLFVAVSTVKKHINNIYRKLEAHSRTQAVARARELNLL
jgi:LuxR family maltose regulon positive regulatory protein